MVGLGGRVLGALRRDGAVYVLKRGARKIAAPLVELGRLDFFARDLERPFPPLEPPAGYDVREALPSEIDRVHEGSDPGRSREALRERFRRGHLCFVVLGPDGRVAHARWVTSDAVELPELRRELRLAAGDAYFYDGFTRPEQRRRGLDELARNAICRALATRGYRRAVSYVRGDNPTGLRAAARWQEAIGSVGWVRIAGGAPRPIGAERIAPLALSPVIGGVGGVDGVGDEEARAARADRWRGWFTSWLNRPLAARSIGFHELPEASFDATAAFVAAQLELDPARDSVLDVGCASAGVTRRNAPLSRAVAGVDSTLGLLAAAAGAGARSASGRPARWVAADGRRLPFAAGAFDKVSCVGTIHTLASEQDATRLVRELLRVCAPGGRVLIGAVPDRRRRWQARLEALRVGDARTRIETLGVALLPARLRAFLRRRLGLASRHELVGLEFDLRRLARAVEDLAPDWRVVPYPRSYWSRDFRAARSNLVLRLPDAQAAAAVALGRTPAAGAALRPERV